MKRKCFERQGGVQVLVTRKAAIQRQKAYTFLRSSLPACCTRLACRLQTRLKTPPLEQRHHLKMRSVLLLLACTLCLSAAAAQVCGYCTEKASPAFQSTASRCVRSASRLALTVVSTLCLFGCGLESSLKTPRTCVLEYFSNRIVGSITPE